MKKKILSSESHLILSYSIQTNIQLKTNTMFTTVAKNFHSPHSAFIVAAPYGALAPHPTRIREPSPRHVSVRGCRTVGLKGWLVTFKHTRSVCCECKQTRVECGDRREGRTFWGFWGLCKYGGGGGSVHVACFWRIRIQGHRVIW